jgi:pyruvate,water dikinase
MGYEQLRMDRRFEDFSAALEQFLRQFGHLSDSGSDFSRQPWREDPDAILRMAIQHSVGYRSRQKPTWDTLPLSAFARWRTRPIYQRARRFRFRREQVSSIYTASYGRFRVLFGALAERLIDAGSLQNRSDIYYLTWPEIQSLAEGAGLAEDARMRIQARRLEIEDSRKVAPPETIYGNVPPPLAGLGAKGGRWEGIPTSPGYYQGPLTVVRSRDDFEKVREGDVIAIPYSDVAWTPLFARAGAVVAEAGGMLSHSSIVAREYGIPCVVSVNEACSLPENSLVYVDGYQGAVRLVSQNGRATGSGSAL